MNEKNQQIQVHFLTPLIRIVTCDEHATILVIIKGKDVLSRVSIFNYLK